MEKTDKSLNASILIQAARVLSVTIHEGHADITDLMQVEATIESIAKGCGGCFHAINADSGLQAYEFEQEGRKGQAEILNQIAYWSWSVTEGHEWAVESFERAARFARPWPLEV